MDPITIIVGTLTTLVAGAGSAVLADWLIKRRKKTSSLGITYAVCIILLGISRSGKTTFIAQLTNDTAADPKIRTASVRTHSKIESIPGRSGQACEISIVDYDGANIGELTAEMTKDSFSRDLATALIVVVDAVDPETPDGRCEKRIDDHLKAWSNTSLSAILGILPAVRYACLYLNKSDLLKGDPASVHEVFDPILKDLKSKVSGHVEYRFGSLTQSMYVSPIKSEILKTMTRRK